MWKFKYIFLLIINILLVLSDDEADKIEDSYVSEYRGFFKREHSFMKPYQVSGIDIPNWEINGTTIVSNHQIRLTSTIQGQQGVIWNSVPVKSRDWELVVSFRIHGDTGKLYGDGMAIWYARDRGLIGDVFGSSNYFSGLGIFLDTYNNDFKSYLHTFPYIYGMVADGTVRYDPGNDGSATRLGGQDSGCEVKFRNKEHETQIMIRYVGDTLTVYQDMENTGKWKKCFRANGVHLPTNYYFGLSAATGDLSDNHDIISVRMFEIEYSRAEKITELDPGHIQPKVDITAPRDHIVHPPPSKMSSWAKYLLIFIGIAATGGGIAVFGYLYYQDRQARSRKRFY